MKTRQPRAAAPDTTDRTRRKLLGGIAAAGGLLATTGEARSDDFGDASHRVVYQLNAFDEDYIKEILHSVAVVLQTYPNDVSIVVTCFGPGIWILVKQAKNRHKLDSYITQMISSQAMYGVEFHACEQTMKSTQLSADDLIDEATPVPSGAVDLISLQEKKYAYIAW